MTNKNITFNSAEVPDHVPDRQSTSFNPNGSRRDSSDIKSWLMLFGVTIAIVLLAGIPFVGLLQWMYSMFDWFFWLVNGCVAVAILSLVGGTAWAIFSFGLGLFNKAQRESLTVLPGGVPAKIGALTGEHSINLADKFLNVKSVEAANSGLRNVTQFSPSISGTASEKAVTGTQEALVAPTAGMPQSEWIEALNDSPHLLIYGPSKAGKSTIAQGYVSTFENVEWIVVDPLPNKPGESKWGGIDFVTLDEGDGDEFASIKKALAQIQAEDERRRRTMRTETFPQLVIIIDEVLGLVDALGVVKNGEGKNEPIMSNFIRRMGYSARHRNIKIILIGQGKNLNDLALKSGTARNNYALIRAERNAATNERIAYIVTSEDERAMDTRGVPVLAKAATDRAKLWLTHTDLQAESSCPSVEKHGFSDTDLAVGQDGQSDITNTLRALRNQGVKREDAREVYGLEFSNDQWTQAGI